ncbi:MAG TPA: 3',5'-cyclic-AMP phosphodiesterase [Pseudomonadales bacterium]|nr:3',5'-cyclic-AMP phosphodiesterase [Pseudomonadales bacterium]
MPQSSKKSEALRGIKVVQLSDSHLFSNPEGKLLGINTNDSLQAVIALIKKEQPDLDLILATGDLSQDGSETSYRRFDALISTLKASSYWLQGNHDNAAGMLQVLAGTERFNPCVIAAGSQWRIILLNSSVKDEIGGHLEKSSLEFLQKALEQLHDKHVLIALHHPLIDIGSAWLDEQKIDNAEQFFNLIKPFKQIKAVLCGHIHQAMEVYHPECDGLRLLSVPSTCFQFKPKQHDFAADDLAPGYRWLELFADGSFSTGVSRISDALFKVDHRLSNY